MIRTWGHLLSPDPYYNPNLTHRMENFAINIDSLLFPEGSDTSEMLQQLLVRRLGKSLSEPTP
ncbi:hypothetical protein [Alkalilimnicola ehrlichii]|uniref:hypothetical protein n=1 Tax=Alkalilimnicola ehrlichii TaxID=351052 RepID=UPI0011C07F23|nr:hypothetical protein [Alkalilimnicola ehrlichii]